MTAVGIDLGGTKIETQIFGDDWAVIDRRRIDTPRDYAALVAALAEQIGWAEAAGGSDIPVGIGAAGLLNPATGLALTANLVATGHPFAADIVRAAKRPVTYVNDCRALTLSEAVFGAGRGLSPVVGLIIGTGIGGGVAVDGRLLAGPGHLGGEFGHTHAPAHLVVAHDLPVIRCGCGRMGCTETYIAGPGLSRIALKFTGRPMSPPDLLAARATDPMAAQVWDIWCQFVAELLMTLTLTVDPACIVLGGGLSKAPDVIDDLTSALRAAQWPGYSVPKIMLAQGGETSGARGAAYAATLAAMEVVHV